MRLISGLLAFSLSLAFTSCGTHNVKGIHLDSAVTKLVTPDTKVLAGIDADRLKATSFYQTHASQFAFPGLNTTAERLGVDPRRDLSSVVFTWNGQDALAIIQGRFAKSAIEPKLSAGAPRAQFRDFSLYGDARTSFTLLQDGLAIAGTNQAVRHGIDHREDNHDDVPDELTANLGWLSKTDQIWVVSRGTLPFADVPTRSEYSSLLSNFAGFIKGTALGVTVDEGLHLKGRVECVSAEGAKRVNDALRGGIGLARLSTKDNELDMLKLYDAIRVRQDGAVVYLDADLSATEASQLLSLAQRLQSHPAATFPPR